MSPRIATRFAAPVALRPGSADTVRVQCAGDTLKSGSPDIAIRNLQGGMHMAEPVKFLSSRFLSASTLVGADVRNPQDESLGDLKDVMIDATSGKIAYGVLTFGGLLGVGNKLFAIPWEAFRVDPEKERLVLDIPRERLKDAPGFDSDHWPNLADPNVAGEFDRQFGRSPSRESEIIRPH